MLVKQLSVFMENRPGRLYKLTNALGKAGIDFVTLSIADTKDFGIVRFIARDNERAYEILKKEGFTVGITELIGVEVDDKPNALAEVVALMEEANMNIEYLYSFVLTNHNSAKILMRVEDTDRAVRLLEGKGIRLPFSTEPTPRRGPGTGTAPAPGTTSSFSTAAASPWVGTPSSAPPGPLIRSSSWCSRTTGSIRRPAGRRT